MSDSVQPHRWQPTRLPCPWDSPGKNTGVGCHFLLQCMKVKSESEVAQSCPTPRNPMHCGPPGSPVHGIFQARVLEWGATAFSKTFPRAIYRHCSSFCIHSFTCSCPVFPVVLNEEIVFAPLYILASFVKNKVPIGAWIYLWLSILFH